MLTRGYVAGGGGSGGSGGSADFHDSVVATQDTNRNLNGFGNVDGVGLSDGDRVLLTGQTAGAENGIWEAHAGGWTRPADWQTGTVSAGAVIPVEPGGTEFGSTLWILATADPIVVDTTALSLFQIGLVQRVFTFPVENPISGDDIPRFYVPRDFTVLEIRALKIQGTGTFDWELRHSLNANDQGFGTLIESDAGVNNQTTGVQYLPPFLPGNPTVIPAGDWVWLELANVSTGIARPVALLVQMMGIEAGP